MRVSIHLPSLYGIGVWDNGVALFSWGFKAHSETKGRVSRFLGSAKAF